MAACTSTPTAATTSGTDGRSSGTTIVIHNFAFNPSSLTVAPGTRITVENRDGVTHTLTSDTGAFNTGDVAAGATVHFEAPAKPGTYPYRCNIHQFMTGTLTVS